MGMSEVLGPDLWPVVVWCLLCPASANIAALSLLPGRQYPALAFLIEATTDEYLLPLQWTERPLLLTFSHVSRVKLLSR